MLAAPLYVCSLAPATARRSNLSKSLERPDRFPSGRPLFLAPPAAGRHWPGLGAQWGQAAANRSFAGGPRSVVSARVDRSGRHFVFFSRLALYTVYLIELHRCSASLQLDGFSRKGRCSARELGFVGCRAWCCRGAVLEVALW